MKNHFQPHRQNGEIIGYICRDQVKFIHGITARVRQLYDWHQDAIESDVVLISMYNNYGKKFGWDTSTYREDSIKRAGRHLRRKFPDLYQRSEAKIIEDCQMIQAIKHVYAN